MIVVESAGITDVGKKRKGNEDSLYLDNDVGIYVVADGMGGHRAGEVASGLVVKTIKEYMNRFRENKDVEELANIDKSLSKEANRLTAGIHLSNRIVYQESTSKPFYQGMGSTVAAVYFTGDTLIATNVGDSPIYLIRNGTIEMLSELHTLLAHHKANHPGERQPSKKFSHMLTRAMGVEKKVEPYVCEIHCFKDDILILSSDGLTDKVSPEEVLDAAVGRTPEETCKVLVNMANDRGGDDNITIIVLKVKMVKHKKSGIIGLISKIFE